MSNLSETTTIVLIGFMGSGKSTVGPELADRLQYRFVDLDAVIVEQSGKSIPEIFAAEEEEGFRRRETQALATLQGDAGTVVATGGGVVTIAENWPLMRSLGPVVYLRAQLQTVLDRIGEGEGRPLAQGSDRETKLANLLAQRRSFYEKADIVVDTDGLTPNAVARVILDKLHAGSNRC